MKHVSLYVLIALLLASATGFAQTTYVWQGSVSTNFLTAGNWVPARSVRAATDILVFQSGTSVTVTGVATETIGCLQITSGTSLTMQSASTAVLTLGNQTGTDFILEAGASLSLDNTVYLVLAFSANADIQGTFVIGAASLVDFDNAGAVISVGGTITNSGMLLTQATTTTFLAGSIYNHTRNGGNLPIAAWNSGSLCNVTGIIGTLPRNLTQTFGSFAWNCTAQNTALSLNGGPATVLNNFAVTSTGSSTLSYRTATSGTMTISGDFQMNGGTLIVNDGLGSTVINVAGSFQQNGGTLRMTTAQDAHPRLQVSGHFTQNAGTITESSASSGDGTLVLNGSSDQLVTLAGTVNQKINIEVNKPSGIAFLLNDFTAPRNLTLTSGILAIDGHTLRVTGSIAGGSASAYVATNGNGSLVKRNVSSTAITYPIGTLNSYNPVVLSNSGTTDDFGARVREGLSHGTVSLAYVNRQWSISELTSGGSNLSLTLQWNAADENATFNRGDNVVFGVWSGQYWTQSPAILAGAGPYLLTMTGLTQLTDFTAANDGALPVELVSLSASRVAEDIVLRWRTATESNNHGFDIERYSEGTGWLRIGFEAGSGSANTPRNYEYCDLRAAELLAKGSVKYRLRQLDRNGRETLSPVIEVAGYTPDAVALQFDSYPNPAREHITFSFSLRVASDVTLTLHDLNGRERVCLAEKSTYTEGSHAVPARILGLPPGTYIARLRSGNSVQTRRILIAR